MMDAKGQRREAGSEGRIHRSDTAWNHGRGVCKNFPLWSSYTGASPARSSMVPK